MAMLSDFLTKSNVDVDDSRKTVECHERIVRTLVERDRDALSYWLYNDLTHANDLFVRSMEETESR